LVEEFEREALKDAALRSNLDTTELRAGVPADLARWASRAGATQIATPFIPTGPLRDWMLDAKPALDEAGITVVEWGRDWDEAIWPHATAGFFKVKKHIPDILYSIGVT
jgi:deoxyribodipyrimidine photo-lyase